MIGGGNGLEKKPFMEHVREFQLRATVSFIAVLAGSGIAYKFNEQILYWVRKPLDETLYYTSPIGGFSSLFKLCIAAGFALAIPVILYNIFKFFSPLLNKDRQKVVVTYTFFAVVLAYAGLAFAYFLSLPAALNFLSNFAGENIQSLITIDEYYNFAFTYLISFALVFQLPLYVLFTNKITPLSPGGMMKAQRYVVLFSFVGAAILTPTPDPFNQTLMAAPAIVLYQVGVILVFATNHRQNRRLKKRQSINDAYKKAAAKRSAPHVRPKLAATPAVKQWQPQPEIISAHNAKRIKPEPVYVPKINKSKPISSMDFMVSRQQRNLTVKRRPIHYSPRKVNPSLRSKRNDKDVPRGLVLDMVINRP